MLPPQVGLQLPEGGPGRRLVGYHDLGPALGGDGVVLAAPRRLPQAQLGPGGHRPQAAAQEDVGVGPAPVDLSPRVSPRQAAHRNGHPRSCKGFSLYRKNTLSPVSPGAADGEHPLLLRVQIDEGPAPQGGRVQGGRPQHAHLLVHGEDHLQAGVGDVLGVQQGQGHGHGDAVVAPQGGPPGGDKVPVHLQVQPLPLQVFGAARLLLAHHVQVALEDHRLRPLIAGGRLLDDDDIVEGVLVVLQPPGLGKGGAPVAHRLGVPRPVGDGAQLLEIVKHSPGLQRG